MSIPWNQIRDQYEAGSTAEQLSAAFNVPEAVIRRRARGARWGVLRGAAEVLEKLPAVKAGAERVAESAHRAAANLIKSALDDHEAFRTRWRTLLEGTSTSGDLNEIAQAMERMLSANAALLGIGKKDGDGGRGIVHIQLASPSTGPVIEIPTT